MNEQLKHLQSENFDIFHFLPAGEENKIHIQGSCFKELGTKLSGSTMGDCYHIILFQEDKDGAVEKLEESEAILTAPLEYISMLIPLNFYGVICKKTTTSLKFVKETFDMLNSPC